MIADAEVRARFWSKVKKTPSCWLWTGSTASQGYGRFQLRGRYPGAHRVAWALQHGKFSVLYICHHCDVRACVRIDHLFEGSQRDNILDAARKGRLATGIRQGTHTHPECRKRGTLNGHAKLTDQAVRDIRNRYATKTITQTALAREYQISQAVVSKVILRQTWSHIE